MKSFYFSWQRKCLQYLTLVVFTMQVICGFFTRWPFISVYFMPLMCSPPAYIVQLPSMHSKIKSLLSQGNISTACLVFLLVLSSFDGKLYYSC